MQVILNGKSIEAPEGITILELAKSQGIHIPTLCNDEELKPYGSCWVCAVKVEGKRGFVTSCGTAISPGMQITTDSEEIHAARKMALELLISDHYADCEAPCKVACPDHVDIQTYVSLIANGKYHEAVKVIKDTLPMPLSIGRVCPAFCEAECRRQIVDEPIAIRQLKRFAADEDLKDYWQYVPERKSDNGKRVAIIGGGPSGLTCGYYLSFEGFTVDLYEAEDACGGWLRFGIPEYRLPKKVLDEEIAMMCSGGMKIHYSKALGKELDLQSLSRDYDAVYLAVGAQNAVAMPVPGSDLHGCYLGVDFLKAHAKGNTYAIGKKVAIVGGGNTAIDCARTSIRLGCDVTVIYRRSKEEMPAEPFEIEAAKHEGVHFHFLCNPVEYLGENGTLKKVKIEKMRLGEPDKSGRRRPEPTGEYFTEVYDSIIAAISQVPDVSPFTMPENEVEGKKFPISRWQTAIVDDHTMYSGVANIFAGGDFQRGAATAIEAIADGRIAAEAISEYLLKGELPKARFVFDSKKAKRVQDVSYKEYEGFKKKIREKMPEIPLELAQSTFNEVETGFSETQARAEAARCIECGCQVNTQCSLRKYCSEYEIDPDRFMGGISRHPIDYSHPYIIRDANKCINCARCMRTCSDIQGASVLGFIYRGFTVVMAPEFGESLTQTNCMSCGKCIEVCPVGALVERNLHYKMNPAPKDKIRQNCALCGVGCDISVEIQAREVARITTPDEAGFNGKNLCFKGRFGWQAIQNKLQNPLMLKNGEYSQISWGEALDLMQSALKVSRSSSVEISPHISLEEMLVASRIANALNCELSADASYRAFSDRYLDISPKVNPLERLADFNEYVLVGSLNRTLLSMLRLQQMKGEKLILVAMPKDDAFTKFADESYPDLSKLEAKAGRLFIYNQNRIPEGLAGELWNLAGQKNVMHTTDYMNHSGFVALNPRPISEGSLDFSISFGSASSADAKFKVCVTSYKAEACDCQLILPEPSYLELEAHAIGDGGKLTLFQNPLRSSLFGELSRLFYSTGLISPATADIPYWNNLAEELIKELQGYTPHSFSGVDKADLNEVAVSANSPLELEISRLYEMRKNPVSF
ncbi:MAG: FAD-dependent oxidoreductase [Candidatus Cloacimonetes bacterium]|nr:FAD-dependent oxidoreductase [Candidatus Cloacimonadota bacterium]MDD4559722.1 FAD-dependent oxidoreductase [Candidatus Cloacimonadota bacterium]